MPFKPIVARLTPDQKTVLCHAGTEKTGTTYIQSLLKSNADLLLAHNTLYPRGVGELGFGHHAIPQDLILHPGEETPAIKYYAEQGLSDSRHLLLSSEGIYELGEASLVEFREMYEDVRTIFVIVFLREPAGYLKSLWQERVKHGMTESAPDYVDRMLRQAYVDYHTNYEFTLVKLQQVFGDGVVPVLYDNVLEHKQDILTYLLRDVIGFGLSIDDFSKAQVYPNAGLPFETSEILRLMNMTLLRRGVEPGSWQVGYLLAEPPDEDLKAAFARFRRTVEVDSRAEPLFDIERTVARRHGRLFPNAASADTLFRRAYRRDVEYVDLDELTKAMPEIADRAEILVDRALAWQKALG